MRAATRLNSKDQLIETVIDQLLVTLPIQQLLQQQQFQYEKLEVYRLRVSDRDLVSELLLIVLVYDIERHLFVACHCSHHLIVSVPYSSLTEQNKRVFVAEMNLSDER